MTKKFYMALGGSAILLGFIEYLRANKITTYNAPIKSRIGKTLPQAKKDMKAIMNSVSNAGLEFLKRLETFSPRAYYDVKGWSIGYGHFMGAKTMDNITQAQADTLLATDTVWVSAALSKYVKVPLTQNQHDALFSFIYNVGATNFANSTLLKKLNAGDYAGAAAQFSVWNKIRKDGAFVVASALVDRRSQEKDLFLA